MDISQPTVENLKALLIDKFDEQRFDTHAQWVAGVEATFPKLEEIMRGATYCLRWQTAPESAGQEPKEHFVNSNRSQFHLAIIRQFLLNPPEDSTAFLIHLEKVPHWRRELWLFAWEPDEARNQSEYLPGVIAHLITFEPYEIKRKLVNDWCQGESAQAIELLQNMIASLDQMEFSPQDEQLAYLLKWTYQVEPKIS